MTTTVQVVVPSHADHKAKVEYHDRSDSGETRNSLAGIVLPGELNTFHVHASRDILISEIALDNDEGSETSAAVESGA